MEDTTTKQPWNYIVLLIIAGEAIFILPFVLARVFRATVLDVFNITNTEIGYCFSIYGLIALVSYLTGGPLADKFLPRKLMGIALILTAAGGLVYAGNPSLITLTILYGYWGFTTIFLFWAGMIKATRVWGGTNNQGKAFGFLDGGRGLVGALFGLLGVIIFSWFVPDNAVELNTTQQKDAFKMVIYISSVLVAITGFIIYFFLKLNSSDSQDLPTKTRQTDNIIRFEKEPIIKDKITKENIKQVLQIPSVWLLMIIILCAYVGYKITDIFSLYASQVLDYNEVEAAQTGTFLLFMRPVVGVIIGFLADRTRASVYLILGFLLTLTGAILFASGILPDSPTLFFFITIIITAIGVYSARVLYFAVLEEGNIPLILTGTAVGVISFIGYTPDIFAGPMIGYFLDGWKGAQGHQYVFWALSGFSVIGLITSLIFYRINKPDKYI